MNLNTLEEIERAVSQLSPEELSAFRLWFAEFDTDPTIQAAWTTEAKRRRDEIRNGSVQAIPGDDGLAQVRQLLEQ
ncbi:Putative addiction module component [Nostoc sp. PCC 7524]|uniref:addiction module protein n=1 Tax=Nostoc sp. (strain ATCC 29411 / PCC 7524) TaxID=28072 RepID=UPI00029EDF69|nr:addiction module protein [Nostoc sp. PCC 7524]AFY47070.1 Putative addiction module component [Nostoc sp. PCC 7524]